MATINQHLNKIKEEPEKAFSLVVNGAEVKYEND